MKEKAMINQALQGFKMNWVAPITQQTRQRVILYWALFILSLALLLAYFNYAGHTTQDLDFGPAWSEKSEGTELAFRSGPPPPWYS
jgi:hypothetical protein